MLKLNIFQQTNSHSIIVLVSSIKTKDKEGKKLGGGNFPSWPLPEATSLSEGSRESLDCNDDGNYDDDENGVAADQ